MNGITHGLAKEGVPTPLEIAREKERDLRERSYPVDSIDHREQVMLFNTPTSILVRELLRRFGYAN